MLGINTNVDSSSPHCPIYFDKINECVHCGAKRSLIMVDSYGKECREEIYPFDHIICKKCGKTYYIKWCKDEETGKMYPCAIDPDISKTFNDCFGNISK